MERVEIQEYDQNWGQCKKKGRLVQLRGTGEIEWTDTGNKQNIKSSEEESKGHIYAIAFNPSV